MKDIVFMFKKDKNLLISHLCNLLSIYMNPVT